jgi:hypothetical protein
VFGTRIACVTERDAGMRAGRIGEGADADARSSASGTSGGRVDVTIVDAIRPTVHDGHGERRRRATGRCTQTATRRAGARQTRDSHVSPTQMEAACQRPCATIL